MVAVKAVRSSLQNLHVAMADPAPMPEAARYRVPFQSRGECQASETCLGLTGALPAISRSRHAQHFNAIGAAVGERICAVRLRRTEHCDQPQPGRPEA